MKQVERITRILARIVRRAARVLGRVHNPAPPLHLSGAGPKAAWDLYSDRWESTVQTFGQRYLGDEWGCANLTDEIISNYVAPFLPPEPIVLEIGCGGGKFSERLAPLSRLLICGDVSSKMLQRTRNRLEHFPNIRFEELNGLDLHQFSSGSLDFVFSFDCFVHVEIEDVYCYLVEIRRVLCNGGRGLLHFANLNSEEGWGKFTTEAPSNRGNQKQFARLCYLTWEIVERMFQSLDLRILTHKREPWRDILVVFQR